MKNKLVKSLTVAGCILVGALTNSFDKEVIGPAPFINPIATNTTVKGLKEIESRRPKNTDTAYSLDFFGIKIPLVTYREVTDPETGMSVRGRLDSEGNIHSRGQVHKLFFAHDSQWYNFN